MQEKINNLLSELGELKNALLELEGTQDIHFKKMGYSQNFIDSIRGDLDSKNAVYVRMIEQKKLQIQKYEEVRDGEKENLQQ